MEPWKIAFMRRYYFSEEQNKGYSDKDVEEHMARYTQSAYHNTFSSDRALHFKAGWETCIQTLSEFFLKLESK